MAHHRVLILAQDSLFRSGIESSLGHQRGMSIFSLAPTDEDTMAAEIEHLQPTTIIIDGTEVTEQAELILYLLNAFPSIQLIGLSLATNRISIYNKEEVRVTTLNDLVDSFM